MRLLSSGMSRQGDYERTGGIDGAVAASARAVPPMPPEQRDQALRCHREIVCLRLVFLLITRIATWLRLSRTQTWAVYARVLRDWMVFLGAHGGRRSGSGWAGPGAARGSWRPSATCGAAGPCPGWFRPGRWDRPRMPAADWPASRRGTDDGDLEAERSTRSCGGARRRAVPSRRSGPSMTPPGGGRGPLPPP